MLKRILTIIISLTFLLGCAAAETAVEPEATTYRITLKTFPCYFNSATDVWQEDFPLYFINDTEDIPFVELNDWADFLNKAGTELGGEGYQVTLEVKEAENKAVFTRENQFFMQIDFEKQTFSYADFLGFVQEANGRYMDAGGLPELDNEGRPFLLNYTKTRNLYGDYTVVDLKKYNIPIIIQDGKYLLPMQTMMAFTDPSRGYGAYFNGEAVFFATIQSMTDSTNLFVNYAYLNGYITPEILQTISQMEGTRDERFAALCDMISKGSEAGASLVDGFMKERETLVYAKYTDVPKKPRSQGLIAYGYNELCLEMDCFYGLKDTHNITDFNMFFLQNGLAVGLMDPDASVADSAIADLVNYWFDDGHSNFISVSCMAASDPEQTLGFGQESSSDLKTKLLGIKSQHPEALESYYEVGDTAYVTFDTYNSGKDSEGPGGFVDYYKSAEEGTLANDTLAIIIKAHQQIMRENSPIKNVVLDMSCNGGGELLAALYTLGWFLGNGNISIQNQFTSAQTTYYVQSDVNLDHQFDEQDTVMDKGLNLYCLIAPPAFSCGNLVPWVLKADGRVSLLGKITGGGSCVVGYNTTAWGTSFRISSYSRLSFVKNGAYYDVDKGVEPDHVIDNFDHFYDREALTEYIHSLY